MSAMPERTITKYCPRHHLRTLHDGWTVKLTQMHGVDEVYDVGRRVILLDPRGDEEWALAHAAAHLDLSHVTGPGGAFTAIQEADADGLACLNLDLVEARDL